MPVVDARRIGDRRVRTELGRLVLLRKARKLQDFVQMHLLIDSLAQRLPQRRDPRRRATPKTHRRGGGSTLPTAPGGEAAGRSSARPPWPTGRGSRRPRRSSVRWPRMHQGRGSPWDAPLRLPVGSGPVAVSPIPRASREVAAYHRRLTLRGAIPGAGRSRPGSNHRSSAGRRPCARRRAASRPVGAPRSGVPGEPDPGSYRPGRRPPARRIGRHPAAHCGGGRRPGAASGSGRGGHGGRGRRPARRNSPAFRVESSPGRRPGGSTARSRRSRRHDGRARNGSPCGRP